MKSLHQEGNSLHTIAARLDLARNTVRRYVGMEGPIQPTPRPRKPSQLDPFYDYLCQRFKDGCSNAHQLFAELQEHGYRGGESSVRSFVARLRKGWSGMARPPKHAHTQAARSAVSPRELRWLLAKRDEDLTPEERQALNRLLESSQEGMELSCLLQSFLQMLRLRQPERLNGWMSEFSSPSPEVASPRLTLWRSSPKSRMSHLAISIDNTPQIHWLRFSALGEQFYCDTSAMLTQLSQQEDYAWLNEVSCACVPPQQALRHLDKAFRNFFEGRAKYPTFKKRRNRKSAEYTTSAFKWNGTSLQLAKMRSNWREHRDGTPRRRKAPRIEPKPVQR